MSAKNKYLVVSILAIVAVLGIMITRRANNGPGDLRSGGETTPPAQTIAPSGNPDDAVQAFVNDADAETAQIEADDNSDEILNSDVTNLSEFSHSADNYDF
ncbi:MAG: hypothetical protein A2722_01100 [Candidatus Doudnabacteria bacterium RIFCSPHIGHO2_01_FULL_50_11]|uniref:Uncharacterized protein n=1 Tax=Candidatus Doudnabacteria bacterium RIFCSPHIGHO2_01_FULL_50_11 TaxID=1817828 RepID=A0A1F5PEV0_9BACT|nr:MAG: hypothetical protein A2722_01100 [Candidatus Doudnabacteria bacterium RIFCSPHIGHO2_01_FULL_50_11]HLC44407.1 hypothetical protein [Patescibacteria group bacterium]